MEDIEHYDIPVYNFPFDIEEDDEDTIQDNSELRVSVLTFISSRQFLRDNTRPFYLLLSSVRKRRLRSTANLFAPVSILGELPKLITRGIPTSAG